MSNMEGKEKAEKVEITTQWICEASGQNQSYVGKYRSAEVGISCK